MTIRFESGLPYVTVTLRRGEQELELHQVVIDTGAAISIFDSDRLEEIGVLIEPFDPIYEVRGVGGIEQVHTKCIDQIEVGGLKIDNFCFDMGPMDYGFPIDGLLGSDFLLLTGAVIDYGQGRIYAGPEQSIL